MCGIAGFFGNFTEETLSKMHSAQSHRGPDDGGKYYSAENQIGLCHQRLAIVDLDPRGKCPMWNEDGTIALLFNGEIFNHQELRDALSHHTFKSNMDGEVIIHLYEDEGVEFLSKLNGMFAFAIWDNKRKRLFIARDRFGVKPLYYSVLPQGLAFASELKTLLKIPAKDLPRDLNFEAIALQLQYLWCPPSYTMLKHVSKLEVGSYIVFEAGKIHKKQWWDFPYPFPVNHQIPTKDWPNLFWESLKRSVKSQLMSDVPLGAFLSGGIDSSAVVAAMSELMNPQEITCFTVAFAGGGSRDKGTEDIKYARLVAKYLRVNLKEITINPITLEQLSKVVWSLDEPLADPAAFNTWMVCEAARKAGIKVLLSGAGGDDLLSGYRRHQTLRLSQYLNFVPKSIFGFIEYATSGLSVANPQIRKAKKLAHLLSLDFAEHVKESHNWLSPNKVKSLFKADISSTIFAKDKFDPIVESLSRSEKEPDWLNRQIQLECRHFLADQGLLYTDKMSMASGVEVRVPFLDNDLAETSFTIPANIKMSGLTPKKILRDAIKGKVPDEILYRPKTGFNSPIRDWLQGDLKEAISELPNSQLTGDLGMFSKEKLSSMIRDNQSGKEDYSYPLLTLLNLDLWLKELANS